MNILFVCKYNRFRSRVAEAYFNKINKNKNIKAASAGLIRGWFPLDKDEVKVAKEFGLNIIGEPRSLSTALLKQQDKLIIVADNVPASLFDEVMIADNTDIRFNKTGKIINWRIQDEKAGRKENIRKIIKSIIFKVNKLVGELK